MQVFAAGLHWENRSEEAFYAPAVFDPGQTGAVPSDKQWYHFMSPFIDINPVVALVAILHGAPKVKEEARPQVSAALVNRTTE